MLGFKTGQELKDIVENALCVCLTSEWYENGPYSIMEAQAVGKPVIVSDNGGLPELVKDGETGYIVKSRDVDDLKEKLEFCEKKIGWESDKIVQWAKVKYSPDEYVKKLQKIYKQLCQ